MTSISGSGLAVILESSSNVQTEYQPFCRCNPSASDITICQDYHKPKNCRTARIHAGMPGPVGGDAYMRNCWTPFDVRGHTHIFVCDISGIRGRGENREAVHRCRPASHRLRIGVGRRHAGRPRSSDAGLSTNPQFHRPLVRPAAKGARPGRLRGCPGPAQPQAPVSPDGWHGPDATQSAGANGRMAGSLSDPFSPPCARELR